MQARRPRFPADRSTHARVTERFVAAAQNGDLPALLEMLAPDVTLWTDGGGKVAASARQPVTGRDKVVRALGGYARRGALLDVRFRAMNGDPSIVVFDGPRPHVVLVLDLDKLARVRL